MDTLSPNWKAISTVHIRYQTFVTPEIQQAQISKNKTHYTVNGTSASDICKLYEEITNTPSNSKDKARKLKVPVTVKRKKVISHTPKSFTKNSLFKASIEDNAELVFEIYAENPTLLNQTDEFGWSALMMSACEGSAKSFNVLLELGANINIKDKGNNSALSLAKNKNRQNILIAFSEYNQRNFQCDGDNKPNECTELQKSDPFFCEICQHVFKESTREEHNTSTLHQFTVKHHKFPRRFGISETNKGFQLMLKQGWDKNSGLGPENSGNLFPVKTLLREFRTGLGIEQNTEPRITHFKPYDIRAIKRRNSDPKPETKKDFIKRIDKDRRKERKLRAELS